MRERNAARERSGAPGRRRPRRARRIDDHAHFAGRAGGVASTPVVNRPEVAIVGVNKIVVRPVWRDGGFRSAKSHEPVVVVRSSGRRRLRRRDLHSAPARIDRDPGDDLHRGLTWEPAGVASLEERFTSGEIISKPAEASAKPAGKRLQSRRKENPSGCKLLFQRPAPPRCRRPQDGIARILVFEKDLPENLGDRLRLGPDLSSRLPIR